MATAKYVQRGETIDYANMTEEVIPANAIISLTTRIGIAGTEILPGETGSCHVDGVFEIPKGSTAFMVGAAVTYDIDTEQLVAEGGVPAGWIVEPAAAGDATAKVKIG